ncbi:Long-chain-fatty-acid--CoA ligase [Achlya hypogyna]|uniref:Long-chain-fatty-acid--CoA ligase n=1 Tax=Achlya hypogyna TaxID=1202772 RepID=A0A1V9ZHS8_ACHHY|nr:Long-chain-fatty-acid--CoA ligase [Achlya hypogyna]
MTNTQSNTTTLLTSLVPTPTSIAVQGALAIGVSGLLYSKLASSPIVPPTAYAKPDLSTARPDHGPIYRCGDSFPVLQCGTQLELLQATVTKYPSNRFLGRRPIDSATGEVGPFVWQTYAEVYERVQSIASGLLLERLTKATADGLKLVGIYMKNRPEWSLAQYSAFYCGAAIVPLYDTLGTAATTYILNQTQTPTVVCTTAEWPGLLQKASATTFLRHIVLADVDTVPAVIAESAEAHGWRVTTLLAVEIAGRAALSPPQSLASSDLCIIMYTSGTTGDPKGAMITHGSLLTLLYALDERINHGAVDVMLKQHPTLLSYLPLAHVAEQQLHIFVVRHAGAIGFYQGSALTILDDLKALRPTMFLSVPRLLNRIYDKVMASAAAAGGLKSALFTYAYETKRANLARGYGTHAVYDRLVFAKVKAQLGLDKCALMLSGAAPLAPHVLTFFRIVLGCTCFEIYGQTEIAGASNITDHREMDAGTVGPPLQSCEVKLVSVPDMGYNVTDTVHSDGSVIAGRGEVCLRGPAVFSGYFKNAEKTAEAIDTDGWLHSGDIGVWTVDGRLKIVDRKKNIFKLSQGEYVAPEKVENVVKESSFVNLVFVHGDSLHATLVAVVVPEEAVVLALAEEFGLTGNFATMCQEPRVVAAVLTDMVRVSKAHGLLGFETVRAVHLSPVAFSVENDLLTPTFKIKRNEVKKAYHAEIEALYAKTDSVAGANVMQA